MTSEATREACKGISVNMRAGRARGQYNKTCGSYGSIKITKGLVAEARGDGAKEVAQAWPDAEANQQVALIRGIAIRAARVRAEEQAVKDGDET